MPQLHPDQRAEIEQMIARAIAEAIRQLTTAANGQNPHQAHTQNPTPLADTAATPNGSPSAARPKNVEQVGPPGPPRPTNPKPRTRPRSDT